MTSKGNAPSSSEIRYNYKVIVFQLKTDRLIFGIEKHEDVPVPIAASVCCASQVDAAATLFPFKESSEDKTLLICSIPYEAFPKELGEYRISAVLTDSAGEIFYAPFNLNFNNTYVPAAYNSNQRTPLFSWGSLGLFFRLIKGKRMLFYVAEQHYSYLDYEDCQTLETALANNDIAYTGRMAIRCLGGQNWQWLFEIPGFVPCPESTFILRALRKDVYIDCPIEIVQVEDNTVRFLADFSSMQNTVKNSRFAFWRLRLLICTGNKFQDIILYRPCCNTYCISDREKYFHDQRYRFSAPIGEMPLVETVVQCLVCARKTEDCWLLLNDKVRCL